MTNMQHANMRIGNTLTVPADDAPVSDSNLDNSSNSAISSPRSQKASIETNASQFSQASLSDSVRDLTPPSSIASSQDRPQSSVASNELDKNDTPVASKKRTANGEFKGVRGGPDDSYQARHKRTLSALSSSSSTSVSELSHSLKTTLNYALVKVQHGWQHHSLDEVESLASNSPGSAISSRSKPNREKHLSPRSVMAAKRETTNLGSIFTDIVPPSGTQRRVLQSNASHSGHRLAPPADIVSGTRRRPTSNTQLQIDTVRSPSRPNVQQRTPSQNAAMEADAVETLLFMSASPINAGRFPSVYSPMSQTFSNPTSPLKSQFSPTYSKPIKPVEKKSALIGRLLENLDEEDCVELDKAVTIMEQRRAARLST